MRIKSILGTTPESATLYLDDIASQIKVQRDLLRDESNHSVFQRLRLGLVYLVTILTAAGCTPEGYIQAKKGDTISGYAAGEEIYDQKDINHYVDHFLTANNGHRFLEDGQTLVIGDWYWARDDNRDGEVAGREILTNEERKEAMAKAAIVPIPIPEKEPTPAEIQYKLGAEIYKLPIKNSKQRLEGVEYFNNAYSLAVEEGNLELAADALFSGAYLQWEQDSRGANFEKSRAAYQSASTFITGHHVRENLLEDITAKLSAMDKYK